MSAKVYITTGKWSGFYHGQPIPGTCRNGHDGHLVVRLISGKGQRYCDKCRDERSKKWSDANPEKVKKSARESSARWLKKNPNYVNQWRQTDAGKSCMAKDRARKRGAARDDVAYVTDNHCAVCGSTERLQVEHLHPISRGGTDFITNKATMCQPCNLSKGTMSVADGRFLPWFIRRRREADL